MSHVTNIDNHLVSREIVDFLKNLGHFEDWKNGKPFNVESESEYHEVECSEHGKDCRGEDWVFWYEYVYGYIENDDLTISKEKTDKSRPILAFQSQVGDSDANFEPDQLIEINTKSDLDKINKILESGVEGNGE